MSLVNNDKMNYDRMGEECVIHTPEIGSIEGQTICCVMQENYIVAVPITNDSPIVIKQNGKTINKWMDSGFFKKETVLFIRKNFPIDQWAYFVVDQKNWYPRKKTLDEMLNELNKEVNG